MEKPVTIDGKEYASWSEWSNSPEHQEFLKSVKEAQDAYAQQAAEKFNALPSEEQLQMFYQIVKNIHQAELIDQGSYRHAIYNVFGFGYDAYTLGMDCGYMDLHNAIYSDEELKESLEKIFGLLNVEYDRKLFDRAMNILRYGCDKTGTSLRYRQLTLDLTWG